MQQIQLSIPEPCHENWQNMTPTQQGRFCNACAKQVIDFSNMSDTAVLNYFYTLKNEKVCGRVFTDQLERTIAMPKYPAKKLFWHWNYITMLFLFFSKTNIAKAQGAIKAVTQLQFSNTDKPAVINNVLAGRTGKIAVSRGHIFTGEITDKSGRPVSFASVQVIDTKYGVSADAFGKFSVKVNGPDSMIEISALGYEVKRLAIHDFTIQNIVLKKNEVTLDSVVVVASQVQGRLSCTAGGISVRVVNRNVFKDSVKAIITYLNGAIKISPNPVQKGNSFSLSLKLKQTGAYNIQIIDAAGRVIVQRQINATAKEYTEQMQTSSIWSSGIYYVRVFNGKNNFISTSSFSLQ